MPAVPGFYKVLIWGGRGRSAPRVSSGIERGPPPKFTGTSTFEVASSVSSEAPSSIERRVARIWNTSPFDFASRSAMRVSGHRVWEPPKVVAHQPWIVRFSQRRRAFGH